MSDKTVVTESAVELIEEIEVKEEVVDIKEESVEVKEEVQVQEEVVDETLTVENNETVVVIPKNLRKAENIVLAQSVLITLYTNEREFAENDSKVRVRIIDPEEFEVIGNKINRRRFIVFAHAKWVNGKYNRDGKTFDKAKAGDSWLVDIIKHKYSVYAVPVELVDTPVKK